MPKGLQKLFVWIAEDHTVQSWRLHGENTYVLSIRFKPVSAISNTSHGDVQSCIHSGQAAIYHRSKPLSAIQRDSRRQQTWMAKQQGQVERHGVVDGAIDDMISPNMFVVEDTSHSPANVNSMDCVNSQMSDSGYIQPPFSQWSHHKPNICSTPAHTIDNSNHSVPLSQMVHTSIQTEATSSCVSVQTEERMKVTNSILTQHPQLKKRAMQTDNILQAETDAQTEYVSTINVEVQSDAIVTCSAGTTIQCYIGEDKSSATDPPENRHTQTWIIKTLEKKIGPTTKSNSTQVDHVYQIQTETQTPYTEHIDQPYVQSMDDYLFQKHQELHDLQSDLFHYLEIRSHKIQRLTDEIRSLKDILDDNSIT